MKATTLIALCTMFSIYAFSQQRTTFSKIEVQEDLNTLRESLEDAHYNLYAYTTKQEFDSVYQKVKSTIQSDSLNLLQTIIIFQQLISSVNNGHTEIDFPGGPYISYAHSGGTVFPLELAFENGKSLVRKNWSDISDIIPGVEVVSINGTPISQILAKIYPQLSAESLYFKNAKVELYSFPRLYWQVFGEQDDFEVEIRSEGKVKKYNFKAVSTIEGYEARRNEILNARMTLQFFNHSAYLNPGNFSGDETRYRQFIDSAFMEINKRKCKNLIVDLRNNGGGNDSFSDYLISYFADQPFKWNSSFTLKTSAFLKEHVRQHYDTTEVFWQEVLAHENGEVYPYTFEEYAPQPQKNRFEGEVFVLINRQSHSQSTVAAAQIKDYKFGTIVGEETAEYPTLYASQFQFNLPNTGIPVKVSKGYIVRVNGNKEDKGLVPDVFIKDHLLDENDEILTGLLEQLGEKPK